MDVDDELNGRTDFVFDSPTEQNKIWARHLADVILEGPSATNDDPRLPPDLVAVVAEILAGDNDLPTITRLNRVSREVHEGTLPVLYETVNFDNEKSVERSIRATHPKGFKYCKFLFVTEITLPLLRMYLRHQTYHLPEPSMDLKQLFPRLAMLGLSRLQPHVPERTLTDDEYPVYVTLYRSLSIPAIMRATLSHDSIGSPRGISFFGTYYYQPAPGGNRIRPSVFRDIVGLTLMPGAYLRRLTGHVGMTGWHPTWAGFDYKLEIDDEVFTPGVQESVRLVLDHLAVQTTMPIPREVKEENDRRLEIKCSPDVFERFIELFHSSQPCFLDIRVELTLPVSSETMGRLVRALGEAYTVNWHHRPECEHQIFAQIQAPVDDVSKLVVADASTFRDERQQVVYRGELAFGNHAEDEQAARDMMGPARPITGAGYTAVVAEALVSDDDDGVIVWEANFPVAHVPFYPLPEGQMPRMRQVELDDVLARIRMVERGHAPGNMDEGGGGVAGPGVDDRPFAPVPEVLTRIMEHYGALAARERDDSEVEEEDDEGEDASQNEGEEEGGSGGE